MAAARLTLADRRRLEVARALATRPSLLLLDEVMAGLRPAEIDELVAVLRDIQRDESGLTILLTEHVMRAVMALSDRSWCCTTARSSRGAPRPSWCGIPPCSRVIWARRRRSDALGRATSISSTATRRRSPACPWTVAERAIVALIGANGAGKSSLIRAIAGMERPRAGKIAFSGQDITGWPTRMASCNLGIGQVAEGRQIFPSLTVEENLEVGAYLSRARVRRSVDAGGVRAVSAPRRAAAADRRHMSGGEQQMLAIGRCLMCRPELIMFDEPSLGLAPTSRAGGVPRDRLLNEERPHDAAGGAERRRIAAGSPNTPTCSRTGASSCRGAARTCFMTTASARPTSVFSRSAPQARLATIVFSGSRTPALRAGAASVALERSRGGSCDRCRASIPSRSAPSAAPSR